MRGSRDWSSGVCASELQTLLARYRNLPPRRRIALWFFLLGALMLSYALLGLRGIIAPPRLP